MATGVPSKIKRDRAKVVRIEYDGKQEESEILRCEPETFDVVYSGSRGKRLYFCDNLSGLRTLLFYPDVKGKVTLVYIDPPFATRGSFLSRKQIKAYDDHLSGADYVEFMRERLIILRELLSDSGSIYLHLDENIVFEMKLVMDEIFGRSNYRNFIVRKKCNPKNYTRKTYGNIADYILLYSKTEKYIWNRPVEPLSEESAKEYRYIEPETGRRYMKVPIHAPGKRNGSTGGVWRGMLPPSGKHWQYTPETLEEMDARGEIFWSKNGNPRRKVYLDEHPGVGVQDIWLDSRDPHNQNIKITGYPTEKNPDLLRRIIKASSNPGDLVLDCFAGSGTTLAVADELQRNWIGMDNSPEAINTILKRFERGLLPMGDYVSKTKGRSEGNTMQATLFDTLENSASITPSLESSEHRTITDFTIYIDRQAPREVINAINHWKDKNVVYSTKEQASFLISESLNLAEICYRLRVKDKKLARVIDRVGPCALDRQHAGFEFLVDAIISQQLSKTVADKIILRFRELFSGNRVTPKKFLPMSKDEVLRVGISKRKYEYIFDLAQRVQSSELRLSRLEIESDESIRRILKKVKGIGDWTVDMYLLFGLARIDVFPVHDLALRKVMSSVYGIETDDINRASNIAERWRPYRSIGAWYLYKHGNRKA